MKRKEIQIDPSVFRQIFLKEVKKDLAKLRKNKLFLMKKATKQEFIRHFELLIHELETAKIANKDLEANRKQYTKVRNDIWIRSFLPYGICLLGLLLIAAIILVIKIN
ncbi:hypothetical protein [Mycoplasmopsis gallopavonis]|uniref:Uncharacterized protein n=1 Tax=Mycoplasmopsis gallopavonis TaxID=76629 RepID=A0A449AZC3_9BACT|nr:hypothetical protein [Mycoplasmopsis gallopavonis]RIV16358.1 hypothetical protein D1113_02705 [Mycoplasmopsis gallopavonis]VEU72873.1 Uncharacterised protein [Mycoplasmopsis gallopavonis]